MKKSLAVFLYLFLVCPIIAQEAVEASAPAAVPYEPVTFFTIVANSGFIGIGIWIFIFSLAGIGILLGLVAIISSVNTKSIQIPLAVKLQFLGLLLLFLLGLLGAVTGTVDSFACVAMHTGAEKAQILALAISQTLYSLAFSLFGCIEYIFFIMISVIVLHFKHKKIMTQNLQQSE